MLTKPAKTETTRIAGQTRTPPKLLHAVRGRRSKLRLQRRQQCSPGPKQLSMQTDHSAAHLNLSLHEPGSRCCPPKRHRPWPWLPRTPRMIGDLALGWPDCPGFSESSGGPEGVHNVRQVLLGPLPQLRTRNGSEGAPLCTLYGHRWRGRTCQLPTSLCTRAPPALPASGQASKPSPAGIAAPSGKVPPPPRLTFSGHLTKRA